MGTVTKSIGTSARDYSTLQAWEDALPANLVTDGNSQVGECYNDSEFIGTGPGVYALDIGGETTDSTHTITLKCAAGQSFKDNANVQTNALRYNISNGVGLKISNYGNGIRNLAVAYVTIDGLQVKDNDGNAGQIIYLAGNNNVAQNFLVQNTAGVGTGGSTIIGGAGATGTNTVFRNGVVISNANNALQWGNVGLLTAANLTLVRPSDGSAFGIGNALRTDAGGHYGGVNKVINCAVFGFANFTDDVTNFGVSSGNNCTDLATAVGSSNQVSKTYSSQFQNTTVAGADFRAKAGADLLNNGATDTTDIPAAVDIAMTSRPQGAAWDIGAWELVVAGASFITAWARNSNLPVIGTGNY